MSDLLPPEVEPGSFASRLYNPAGDFPVLADDDEVSQMVELYRRDRASGGQQPAPAAALTPTPPPTPTPVPEERTDFGGGGEVTPEPEPAPTPTATPEATPEEPPRRKSIYAEPISVASETPTDEAPESPGLGTEAWGGIARGGAHAIKLPVHVAGYFGKELGKLTGVEFTTKLSEAVDGFADGLEQKAQGITPPRSISQAWDAGWGSFANWTVGKTLEGAIGMVPPMIIARYAGIPGAVGYGALTYAVQEARREGSNEASIRAAALDGALAMGAPIKIMHATVGLSLLKRIGAQAAAFAGLGAAAPYTAAIPKHAAGQGYDMPTLEQSVEGAYTGAVLGGAMAPVSGARAAPVTRPPPPVTPPPAAGPTPAAPPPAAPVPPPVPPGRSRIQDQYGVNPPPELTPNVPSTRSKIQERYGTEPLPEAAPPAGVGPKGSPETAPPTVSGDPAATVAIDAAVNPPQAPRSRLQERVGMPVEEAPPAAPAGWETSPVSSSEQTGALPTRAAPVSEAPPAGGAESAARGAEGGTLLQRIQARFGIGAEEVPSSVQIQEVAGVGMVEAGRIRDTMIAARERQAASAAPVREAEPVDGPLPAWGIENNARAVELANRLGVTEQVGDMARAGRTAAEISEALGGRLDADQIRAVRTSLGVEAAGPPGMTFGARRAEPARSALRETTTDVITPKTGYIETKPLTTEPDHLAPARQVAKNEAGEVVGKGATRDEAIADARERGEKPYVEEAPKLTTEPPAATEARAKSKAQTKPKTEEFTEEVKAKASRSWGDLARDDAANAEYKPPSNSDRARTEYQYAWEQAAGDAAWRERLSGEKASAAEAAAKAEAAAEKSAAAKHTLVRKAQPAAAEEAIATSKAQAEVPVAKTETGKPTTVVKRPTKRVEVQVGKRGEAAVGEESVVQRETADAAEAAQQRRLAERRAEKLPPRAQEARRTSLMADEAARDIKDVQEAPATSKVTRGTPIEEVGEGMQIEQVGESIAETRSKTTTDKNLKYNDLLHDLIQGNKDLDTASKEAGSKAPGTRGRPRKNEDLATYLEREVIPRAEKANRADAAYMRRVTPILENRARTTRERDKLLERVYESIQKRAKGRGRSEQERENLEDIKRWRDELRGVEKGGEAEANAPLWRDPVVERGIKAAKRLLNLSINRKLQDRIKRSDETNTLDSAHDYLNDIINDPGAKIAAPDLVELARHLKRMLPDDVEMGSYRALFKNVLGRSEAEAAAKENTSGGTYYGDHDVIGMNARGGDHLVKVTHELVHGVTFKYLDNLYQKQRHGEPLTEREQKHVDTLDAIVKETTRLRDEEAISDAEYNALDYAVRAARMGEPTGSERTVGGRHELLSQTFTDPLVREVMGRTKSSPEFKAAMKELGYGEPANLWQAFKAFVKDIVGFKKDSVLDKVLDPMTEILETSAKYREDLGMGFELGTPLRGSGEAAGRRWKRGDVPTDALPNQWARDMMRPFGEQAAELNASLFSREGVRERYEGWKPAIVRGGSKTALVSSPTHKVAEFNEDVVPAGRQVMDARARTARVAGEYRKKWGDSVQNWVRELRAGPEVAELMNDVTLAKAYMTDQPGLFTSRNAHLTPDEMLVAEKLRDRYNDLTPRQQKLYSDIRDYYRQTHHEQRKLEYEDVVKRFLPEATQPQLEALGNQLSTRRGIKEMIDNPQSVSPEAAALSAAFGERWENSRGLVKEIAKLQDTGFREGDFFPLRRYGDWVLRYGEQGTKDYGVEFFESSNEAATRRVELQKELPAGTHITDVMSKRGDFSRKEFMPESALEDITRAMTKRGASEEAIDQAKDAYAWAMMRRQVSSAQAESRMYRSGVKGASTDAAQTLMNHFNSTAELFGHLTHGAAETEGMRQARQQVTALENASGTPGTAADITRSRTQLDALETRFANRDPAVKQEDIDHARQQHKWLVKPPSSQQTIRARETLNEFESRRMPVDGDNAANWMGKASGKMNAMSWLYQLVRPMHLALNTADSHGKAQALLGADYGQAKAGAAISRAMKDLGPTAINRGFRNAFKAVTGEMQHSDWLVTDQLFQKLNNLKPGDAAHAAEMNGLKEMTLDYNLVDSTRSREVQRLSQKGGFQFGNPTGGKYPWSNVGSNMLNLFSAGEHTVDSTMRMVVVKAAYDLARANGDSPAAAVEAARRHSMDAIPVYGAWNTPRIASPRAPYLKDIVPAMMQFKLYGFQMMAVEGGLVRKALFRPEERAEAIKALAGLTAMASIYGGVTANLFSLPVSALLGAWDLVNGEEKPHNYETDLRQTIADWTGSETAGTFASSGLFGLAGMEQSRSLKMTNLPGIPELKEYSAAGGLEWLVHGMTGPSGDLGGRLFESVHDLATGRYKRAAQNALPRAISDPWKAYDTGNEGVVDRRGRTVMPASQVTLGQQVVKGLGGNPYQQSLAQQRRRAIQEFEGEYEYHRQQAMDRYVRSGGRDMSGVRDYMNNGEYRRVSPIKFSQLREALKDERERQRKPQFYGTQPTKKQRQPFREQTRFY